MRHPCARDLSRTKLATVYKRQSSNRYMRWPRPTPQSGGTPTAAAPSRGAIGTLGYETTTWAPLSIPPEDNGAVVANVVAFLGVSALVIATPGPDTALTIRNALTGGRRAGIFTAAGVATGQATWAVFSAAGVAAILSASQPAFTVVRTLGA